MEVEAAVPEPPSTRTPGTGISGYGASLYSDVERGSWEGLGPIPVANCHKEVIITTLVPSASGFLARLTSHRLEGSESSISKNLAIERSDSWSK